jgi:hypothetical protein
MPYRVLQGDALAKAVRLNPKYSFETGWIDHYWLVDAILRLPANASPEDLANGVFQWQISQPGLKGDGILGPNTWDAMRNAPIPPQPGQKSPPKFLEDTPAKDVKKPTVGSKPNSGVWVGLMVNVGVFTGAMGRDYVRGTMYSIDDSNRTFDAVSDRVRIGVGAGAGVGAAVCIISNLYDRKKLDGHSTSGYDFNLALGGKWSAIAKGAMKFPRIIRVVDHFNDLTRAGRSGKGLIEAMKTTLRNAAKLTPDEYAQLAKLGREAKTTLDNQSEKKPNLNMLTLPVPGTIEASMFYQDDKWSVEPSSAHSGGYGGQLVQPNIYMVR